MISVGLARSLFRVLGENNPQHVIMCGDPNQLPSIEPGNLFADILSHRRFTHNKVTKVLRTEGVQIINASNNAKDSLPIPLIDFPPSKNSNLVYFRVEDSEKLQDVLVKQVLPFIKSKNFNLIEDVQICSWENKTVDFLNVVLQNALNPNWKLKPVGEHQFGLGDRVIQTVNDRDVGIMNGESGVIVDDSDIKIGEDDKGLPKQTEYMTVLVGEEEIIVPVEDTSFKLGYAITIHKSQGSGFPVVVVPVMRKSGRQMDRSLLYTAMTRAAKMLIFIGCDQEANLCIQRVAERRVTNLQDLLNRDHA